jgi:hypothetical protein
MHHIGSSLLPSGLVYTLDPNSPPMTKVTRFIVFLFLDMRIVGGPSSSEGPQKHN